MTISDWLGLAAFFAVVIAGFVVVILGAMRLEGWRARRGQAVFGAALAGLRRTRAPMPGAWVLDELHGTLGGCEVTLRPVVGGGSRVDIGPTTIAMRAIAQELIVRAPDNGRRGTGTFALARRAIVATGVPLPRDPGPLADALAAVGGTVTLTEGVATAALDFPLSKPAGRRAVRLAIALAAYLTEPAA